MARYILKDEKYTKKPVVFDSYKDMIDRVRAVCKEKKMNFNEKDEKSLKYETEKIID